MTADIVRAVQTVAPGEFEPGMVGARGCTWPTARCAARSRCWTRARSPSSSTSAPTLARLPALDWKDIHAIAEGLAGKANDAAYETAVETIFAWLSEPHRNAMAGEGAGRLAPLAEVSDKIAPL